MEEVKEWNGQQRYMWCWDDGDFMVERKKEFVIYIHQENTSYPVYTIDRSTGNDEWYKHCAEIDEAEVDLAEEERLNRVLAYELARAEKRCKEDYARAELSLENVTVIIQRKYPTLVATMTGGELIYTDTANPLDEYYSLEDIRERYKD